MSIILWVSRRRSLYIVIAPIIHGWIYPAMRRWGWRIVGGLRTWWRRIIDWGSILWRRRLSDNNCTSKVVVSAGITVAATAVQTTK
jgi:hypothetical protein